LIISAKKSSILFETESLLSEKTFRLSEKYQLVSSPNKYVKKCALFRGQSKILV
jgi:hypothetical protein